MFKVFHNSCVLLATYSTTYFDNHKLNLLGPIDYFVPNVRRRESFKRII